MSVSITIDDKAVLRMLRNAPDKINRAMSAAMNDATAMLLRDLKTYPAAPPGSTYRRTRTLGRSWSRKISGRGANIVGRVGSNSNIAPYNRYVQDADRQARVHQGRWKNTTQGVAQRRTRAIKRMFRDRLDKELQ